MLLVYLDSIFPVIHPDNVIVILFIGNTLNVP